MIKILRKIIDIIFWIAAVLLLILLFFLGGVRLFGYTPYVITSGSMIPVYPVGECRVCQWCEPGRAGSRG